MGEDDEGYDLRPLSIARTLDANKKYRREWPMPLNLHCVVRISGKARPIFCCVSGAPNCQYFGQPALAFITYVAGESLRLQRTC